MRVLLEAPWPVTLLLRLYCFGYAALARAAEAVAADADVDGVEAGAMFYAAEFLFMVPRGAAGRQTLRSSRRRAPPKQSYQQIKDVSTQGSKKFSIVIKVGLDCLVAFFPVSSSYYFRSRCVFYLCVFYLDRHNFSLLSLSSLLSAYLLSVSLSLPVYAVFSLSLL